MKKIIIIFLFSMVLVIAQEKLDWIVFGSGISGKPGKNVKLIDSLVIDEEIETIRDLIYSDNVAVKCLSSIVLEVLEEKDIIALEKEEKLQIEYVFSSQDRIYYLFGCNDDAIILTIPMFLSLHKNQAIERYTYLIDEFY
ncbi:MAG: hypothetical protein WC121_04985 [Candidatus Kapaibacterium sp.]